LLVIWVWISEKCSNKKSATYTKVLNIFTKYSWVAPDWMIAYSWSVIFLFNGISTVLVFREVADDSVYNTFFIRPPLNIYYLVFLLNLNWFSSFQAQNLLLCVMFITGLLVGVLLIIIFFWKISRYSSVLLVPYLIWVCYLFTLNWWMLINK
jgi:tryptophan-rich sensory protein